MQPLRAMTPHRTTESSRPASPTPSLGRAATQAMGKVPRGSEESAGEKQALASLPVDDQATNPAKKGVEQNYSDTYEISSRAEILHILRDMCRARSLITFYLNHGYDFLLTTILNISADGTTMLLDYGGDMRMNRKALLADSIKCQARIDNIKVQFTLRGVTSVAHEGYDAFLGAVPDALIRLQRRTHFRVTAPKADPLTATIPVRQTDGSMLLLQADVVDISGGGIGLRLAPGNPRIEKDALIFGVVSTLPKIGQVVVDVHVRNVHDETMPNGKVYQRIVCQFVNLPNPMMNMIQHYIFRIQRERIARSHGGMAPSLKP